MEAGEYVKMHQLESQHWWFVAKRKFLKLILKKFSQPGQKTLVDVGCGTGAVMEFCQRLGYSTTGIDMSETALSYCRSRGLAVALGTANTTGYSDDSVDVVLALDVIEHVENDQGAVREIKRILKPGGIFIIMVPAHQWLWSYHDDALHHKRRYSKRSLIKLLEKEFDLEYISWLHSTILLPAWLIRKLKGQSKKAKQDSDVKPASALINKLMGLVYQLELAVLKVFGRLPFGTSLVAVARKQS